MSVVKRVRSERVAILVIMTTLTLHSGQLAAQPSKLHTIDLRRGNNLGMIFDAGLRPWRSRGAENRGLDMAQEEDLTIILPNETHFELEIARASFTVLVGNTLQEANLFGRSESVPGAVQRIRSICAATGFSDDGLDQIANSLGTLPDPNKTWFRSGLVNGVQVSITFFPIWLRDPLQAQVWVVIQWPPFGAPMKFLTEPIQPPPGYEGVPMEAPTYVTPPTPTASPTQVR